PEGIERPLCGQQGGGLAEDRFTAALESRHQRQDERPQHQHEHEHEHDVPHREGTAVQIGDVTETTAARWPVRAAREGRRGVWTSGCGGGHQFSEFALRRWLAIRKPTVMTKSATAPAEPMPSEP